MSESKSGQWAEELSAWEEGVRSKFWGLLQKRLQELAFSVSAETRKPKPENRDYSAGKWAGLEEVLKFPFVRIGHLQDLIKSDQK